MLDPRDARVAHDNHPDGGPRSPTTDPKSRPSPQPARRAGHQPSRARALPPARRHVAARRAAASAALCGSAPRGVRFAPFFWPRSARTCRHWPARLRRVHIRRALRSFASLIRCGVEPRRPLRTDTPPSPPSRPGLPPRRSLPALLRRFSRSPSLAPLFRLRLHSSHGQRSICVRFAPRGVWSGASRFPHRKPQMLLAVAYACARLRALRACGSGSGNRKSSLASPNDYTCRIAR